MQLTKSKTIFILMAFFCLLFFISSPASAQCTDADGDGYYYENGCGTDQDCNDSNPAINTGATETCNGFDDDCDGSLDEVCDTTCNDPEKLGSDKRVSNDSFSSRSAFSVWSGSEFGLAWYDDRDGNSEIYFARLDSSGSIIGSDVRVSEDLGSSLNPCITWAGSEYGISWYDNRDGNNEIYFARFNSSGSKIGSDIRVTYDSSSAGHTSIVWNGSEYAVSWGDYRDGNYEIYFTRLDSSGSKIGSDVRVTYYLQHSWYPSLVWTGSEYGVAWREYRDINDEVYFARLDSSGNKIGSDIRVTSNIQNSLYPSLVWTGSEYGVAWQDNRNGEFEIYFARLDSSGSKIGSDVRVTNDDAYSYSPSLAWSGSEYAISWADVMSGSPEIYFTRLDSSGSKIGSDVRATYDGSSDYKPSLVWTGNDYGVSWDDDRDGNYEIYFAKIGCCDDRDSDGYTECAGDTNDADPDINPDATEICDGKDNDSDASIDEVCDATCDNPEKSGSDIRVTNASLDSKNPSLVWTGSEFGASWVDDRDGNDEIYFARLDSSGGKIGPDIRVTYDSATSLTTRLAWTGSEYGILWRDDRDGSFEIYFARLDSLGNKIGSDVRVTSNDSLGSYSTCIIWTGSEYGIAWEDDRDGNREIYFARLDSSGNKIASDIRVTYAPSDSSYASLVWTGGEYGITWDDDRDGNREVYFAKLDASGNKLGSDIRVTENSLDSYNPSLVWSGSEFGISWSDSRDANYEIYFVRLDSSGSKIGSELRVTYASLDSYRPSLTWTGSEYGISWYDNRDANYEIYFARINSSGSKIGSDLRMTNNSSVSQRPSLVWSGSKNSISWSDNREGNYEIYFAAAECCDDVDSDGYTECAGDTNDADPDINPDATEICDGQDNDSDSSLDEVCDTACDNPEKKGSDIRLTSVDLQSEYPSLVWTGSKYGVSWFDKRDGNWEIYFAHFDSSGNKIDLDVRVTNDDSNSRFCDAPTLVWTGSEYGIAWFDDRDGNTEIYFARLDSSGIKIGADVRVTNADSLSECPSLVWMGSEYGLVWHDERDGVNAEIYFARLDALGTKIGLDVRVTSSGPYSGWARIIWTGSEYGLSWEDWRHGEAEIYFARLDSSGNKIGTDVRVTNDDSASYSPFIAWKGDEYGLSWQDQRDGNDEIYFARLDSSGTKISSDIRLTFTLSDSWVPSLAWTGTEYGLTWYDAPEGNYEIYFARLDSSGSKIGSDIRITSDASNSLRPSPVWIGNEYGISWEEYRDGNGEIYFATVACCDDVDSDGYTECSGDTNDADPGVNPDATEICDGKDNDSDTSIDEVCDSICDDSNKSGSDMRITNASDSSRFPSLIWTGSELGVSWYDQRDGSWEIYFTRLDSSGSKIGSDLRVTENMFASFHPSLVWTGSEYALSWDDQRSDGKYEIYFVRLDSSGSKIGSNVRVTYDLSNSYYPSLVWTGSEYGLSWEDERDGNKEIYFARLDSSGNKIDSNVRVTYDPYTSNEPSLVWTGNEYGVSWWDDRDGNREIYFARLDSSGNMIGSDIRVTYDAMVSYDPSLAWTGNEYGVSWQENRSGGNHEIYFARLDSSGSKIDSDIRVTYDNSNSYYPTLVWTGGEYGVSWHDQRDGNWEIYFARLDSSGSKVGSDVRVTNDASSSYWSSLMWTGSEYGISWEDDRDGNSEIYLAMLSCCDDLDSDSYSECADDCNDLDGSINPGETEICDGIDNNCDDSVDEAVACDTDTQNPGKNGDEEPITDDDNKDSIYSSIDWNGTEYGIVWEDIRDGNWEIYFSRVAKDGTEIGSDIRITSDAAASMRPVIKWAGAESGGKYGIIWYDDRDGNEEIYFTTLNSTGTKLTSDIRITRASGESSQPSMIWTGTVFGLAWQDERDFTGSGNYEIYFARLDSDGNKLGSDIRVTTYSSTKGDPFLGWTGSEYGIVWEDDRDGNFEIYYARLDDLGNKQEHPTTLLTDIRITSADGDSTNPSIKWNGVKFGLVWQDNRSTGGTLQMGDDLYYNGIDSIGDKDGDDIVLTTVDSDSIHAMIEWSGGEWGIIFTDDRDGNYEIYFACLEPNGTEKEDEVRITNNPDVSDHAAIVWNGEDYGTTWDDDSDGTGNDGAEVFFATISDCQDEDLDTYTQCDGDCDDSNSDINPGVTDLCDGVDNNCDGTIDDGDGDSDGVSNCMDNCPGDPNPDQLDVDTDGTGDECDDDDDNDGTDDPGDPYPCDPGNDEDSDGIACNLHTSCGEIDNCCSLYNPGQADKDLDGEGDACEVACTFYIDDDGGTGIDCTAIQECLDVVSPAGCTYLVHPGTYDEDISISKVLTLVSDDGADVTTIDGAGTSPVVTIQEITPTGFVKIEGFTITDGTEGVYINHNTDIESCKIQSVTTGILINNQDGKLTDTIVEKIPTGSSVDVGIYVDNESSHLDISRGTIRNTTNQGILVDGSMYAANTLVTDNTGDGIKVSATGTADIEFCTITNNAMGVNSLNTTPGSVTISTSILYGNTTEFSGITCSDISYSDTDSSCDGTNNCMSGDPLFVDASAYNYRLQSSSPCIEAGYDPATFTGIPCCDFDMNPRLLDKDGDGYAYPDIGAFEYDNSSSLIPGEVQNVHFSISNKDMLIWDTETNSESYRIYGYFSLNYDSSGSCLGSTSIAQFDIGIYDYDYYLVTGVDENPEPDEEGTLGYGSCAERSNYSPCP